MTDLALSIQTLEKKGVLDDITEIFSSHNLNISYAHIYIEKNDYGSINVELENVEDVDELLDDLNNSPLVKKVEVRGSLMDVYGKRILIFGGGAQVSQVALGAITEADRHNIRGERISVDTIPLVGEDNISEAVDALSITPRVNALVLAGSLMGGEITKAVRRVKKEFGLLVISLNMPGSAAKEADLIVTDPIQAGVMAVMAVANTAVFDVDKLDNKKY
ncbi:DUF5612 domain-containing protein [Methanobrevibacter acididurans]|uniref:DUF5612 domain-containing protein n=1 Tax=Methanobrevibacter acididurans TaxID=120963 RepID=UPI0038FCB441